MELRYITVFSVIFVLIHICATYSYRLCEQYSFMDILHITFSMVSLLCPIFHMIFTVFCLKFIINHQAGILWICRLQSFQLLSSRIFFLNHAWKLDFYREYKWIEWEVESWVCRGSVCFSGIGHSFQMRRFHKQFSLTRLHSNSIDLTFSIKVARSSRYNLGILPNLTHQYKICTENKKTPEIILAEHISSEYKTLTKESDFFHTLCTQIINSMNIRSMYKISKGRGSWTFDRFLLLYLTVQCITWHHILRNVLGKVYNFKW